MNALIDVRPFRIEDLEATERFCEQARSLDPLVEPFSQRLGVIANGTRAVLDLWRVAVGEEGEVYGIAFVALRESAQRAVFDFYAAVLPPLRRIGIGRALAAPAVASGAVLRARVPDDARPGPAFLRALGFAQASAQLVLRWNGESVGAPQMPALRIRAGGEKDQATLLRLSNEAWAGAPEAFASRPDEIAQLFGDDGRVVLLAESEGKALGYLAGVQLGRTLGIEEVAVLPDFRRMGIGRALVAQALKGGQGAVLSVSEENKAARALYRSLGFAQTARRLLYELRPEGG